MKELFRRRPSPAMIVAVIAVILAVGGTATAALTKKDKKKVNNIATNVATSVFNKNAPSLKDGCPAGTLRYAGACFETSARSGSSFNGASSTCGDAGRRLPTASELIGLRNQSGITLAGSGVTTAEISSDVFRDVATGFGYIGVTEADVFSVFDLNEIHQFRCVAPLTNS